MNKQHFLYVIRRTLEERSGHPTLEQAFLPLGLGIGLLIALLPGDFKEYWGVPADTWQAITIILVAGSAIWFLYALTRWAYHMITTRPRTERDLYKEFVAEMEEQREQIEEIDREIAQGSESAQD